MKIGSADRIRTENVKVIFLMGVNKNEFPLISSIGGLLTDSDRRVLTNEMSLNIKPAFEKAIALQKPVVIECVIEEDDKVFPMVPAGAPISDAFDADDLKEKN